MAVNIPKQPYGITLPIAHGDGGYFNQSYTIVDQVKSNLLNLLQTSKGERRMNPTFGSDLYKIIFEFSNEEIPNIVESAIRSDIQVWMPYITIQNIIVDITNENRDTYIINVQVAFSVNQIGISDIQTVNVTLNKQIL